MIVSAIKDLAEDLKRHFSDQEENNKETEVFRNGSFVKAKWRDVHVGDIIKVIHKRYAVSNNVLYRSRRVNTSLQIYFF